MSRAPTEADKLRQRCLDLKLKTEGNLKTLKERISIFDNQQRLQKRYREQDAREAAAAVAKREANEEAAKVIVLNWCAASAVIKRL